MSFPFGKLRELDTGYVYKNDSKKVTPEQCPG